MEIIKKKLGDLDRCYTTSYLKTKDEVKIILASEAYVDEGRPCYSYSGENFDNAELVWENSGGCVSMIQIPGRDNEVLAIQDFYQKESPSRARLTWGVYKDGKWEFKDLFNLPYLHRFLPFELNGKLYLICATIADHKRFKEDWETPGSIYAAEIPEDLNNTKIELKRIKTDIYQNHGFCYDNRPGHNEIYFGSQQGIDKLYLKGEIDDWKFERIIEKPIGEIAIIDIDGDGIDEILTIEPFHGNKIRMYKDYGDRLEQIYEYDNEIDFAHALIATTFRGVPTFVCGIRRMDSELFYIQYKDGKYIPTIIEKGIGPANIECLNFEDRDILISANHTKNEAAIYIVKG